MSGKKMMFICGSPNAGGNTRTVVDWVADGARDAGAAVEIVDAAGINYGAIGCAACMRCRDSEEYRCAVDDGAAPVIARIPEQDVVVFATPVYFMSFSAQLKLLIDRMFSLAKVKGGEYVFAPGLKDTDFAVIATAGGGLDDGLTLVKENMEAITGFFGATARSFLVPNAHAEDGVRDSNAALMARARAFGAELSRGRA